jgi:hypothetical protein
MPIWPPPPEYIRAQTGGVRRGEEGRGGGTERVCVCVCVCVEGGVWGGTLCVSNAHACTFARARVNACAYACTPACMASMRVVPWVPRCP